jgi:hypothetical protein
MSDKDQNLGGILPCIAAVVLAPVWWVRGLLAPKTPNDPISGMKAEMDALQQRIDDSKND